MSLLLRDNYILLTHVRTASPCIDTHEPNQMLECALSYSHILLLESHNLPISPGRPIENRVLLRRKIRSTKSYVFLTLIDATETVASLRILSEGDTYDSCILEIVMYNRNVSITERKTLAPLLLLRRNLR